MTKELMDNILKDAFVITFDSSNESNLREVIKDIKTYYDDSTYVYYAFSNDDITLLLVCNQRFDFYVDVLKKAINSKDKMLLEYIIRSINGESREDIRKYFESHKETMDQVIKDDLESLVDIQKEQKLHNKKEKELKWIKYHINLITGIITFNCSMLSSIDRINIINSICNNMLRLLYSDNFPNQVIELSERDYIGIYLFKRKMKNKISNIKYTW